MSDMASTEKLAALLDRAGIGWFKHEGPLERYAVVMERGEDDSEFITVGASTVEEATEIASQRAGAEGYWPVFLADVMEMRVNFLTVDRVSVGREVVS